ncbi:nitroreductase family protein [Caldicellulosiruptoraceae bacterium PP1]
MELLDLIKKRRSIRKYQDKQIPKEDLEKIIEAGLYAPNAGGRQGTIIVGVHNKELTETIGKLNFACFDRSKIAGSYVSKDQPSIIDDPTINNAFYGAPSVCVVFSAKNFLNSIADAFCCTENMVLEATALGISSCIIARAEDTFENELGKKLLKDWQIPENYVARCFVIFGYCDGPYPDIKPRKEGRSRIIE